MNIKANQQVLKRSIVAFGLTLWPLLASNLWSSCFLSTGAAPHLSWKYCFEWANKHTNKQNNNENHPSSTINNWSLKTKLIKHRKWFQTKILHRQRIGQVLFTWLLRRTELFAFVYHKFWHGKNTQNSEPSSNFLRKDNSSTAVLCSPVPTPSFTFRQISIKQIHIIWNL